VPLVVGLTPLVVDLTPLVVDPTPLVVDRAGIEHKAEQDGAQARQVSVVIRKER